MTALGWRLFVLIFGYQAAMRVIAWLERRPVHYRRSPALAMPHACSLAACDPEKGAATPAAPPRDGQSIVNQMLAAVDQHLQGNAEEAAAKQEDDVRAAMRAAGQSELMGSGEQPYMICLRPQPLHPRPLEGERIAVKPPLPIHNFGEFQLHMALASTTYVQRRAGAKTRLS